MPLSSRSGNVLDARAAGVIPDLGRGPRADVLHQLLVPRLDHAAIEFGPEERPFLRGQVVADHDHVHHVAHLVQEDAEPIHPELQRPVDQGLAELRLREHVHEPGFQAAQVPADFVDHAGDPADHGVGRLPPDLQGPLAQPGKPARIVALGKGVVAEVVDRGGGQRMVRDVHVERLVVGHRPGHAELVGQVVPDAGRRAAAGRCRPGNRPPRPRRRTAYRRGTAPAGPRSAGQAAARRP